MNLLKHARSKIVALVQDGLTDVQFITHWDICKALSEGKTQERVAEDFRVHISTVKYVKKCKCNGTN